MHLNYLKSSGDLCKQNSDYLLVDKLSPGMQPRFFRSERCCLMPASVYVLDVLGGTSDVLGTCCCCGVLNCA